MDLFVQIGITGVYCLAWVLTTIKGYNRTKRMTYAQVENLVSLWHGVGCMVLIGMYLFFGSSTLIWSLLYWSQGFYTKEASKYLYTDVSFLSCVGIIATEQYMVALVRDVNDVLGNAVLWGLFVTELTNLPFYIEYHYEHQIQTHQTPWNKKRWLKAQLWAFGGLRNGVGIWYLWLNPLLDVTLWYLGLGFWLGSLWRTYKTWETLQTLTQRLHLSQAFKEPAFKGPRIRCKSF